jgi:hypothetical protein
MRRVRALLAASVVTLAGCDTINNNPGNSNPASPQVVSSDITTATTWTGGNVYEVTAPINVTAPLTIQPGVTVKFDAGAALRVSATITADGQSDTTPIIFTSAAASPAGGDWQGITLNASGSTFNRCRILYAGASDKAALTIGSGYSATVTNCTFAHHKTPTDSIAAAPALDASDAAAGTVVSNNLFFDDRVPLSVNTTFSVPANTFSNSAAAPSAPQPSKYNAVVVRGCSTVATSITWVATVPYVIGDPNDACNYLNVSAAGHLTVQSGAVVKFFKSGRISVDGLLTASAIFTSIKDDARGGDTNGDGAASSPAGSDWAGVFLNKEGSVIDHAGFYYGGGDDRGALELRSAGATVTNSFFGHNRPPNGSITAAPALDAGSAPASAVLTGNTFYDNTVPLAVNTTLSLDDSNAFLGYDWDVVATSGTSTAVGNRYQAIQITGCGQITSSITWAAVKVPLLIGDPTSACNYVTVNGGGHLTIADGTIVKFFPSGSITVNGVLTANATSGIVFTSIKDDAAGGDTNGDGAASAPAGGDWDGISVRLSGSSFNKARFLYGGGLASGGSYPALYLASGKSMSVTNSIFAHTRPSDASIRGPAALDLSDGASTGQGTVVTGNRFFDDTVPLAINTSQTLDDSNMFDSGAATSLAPSTYNGVFVAGCGAVTANTTWSVTQVPVVIGNPGDACNYLTVPGGGHLTLGPNLVMKFFSAGRITVDAGGLFTIDASDWLTSIADDRLNDTNADGSATSPAVGDWKGVKRSQQNASPVCDQSAYMHYQLPNQTGGGCGF